MITVVKRSNDWMAYLNGDTGMWGCGASYCEAIGNLVSSHQSELGITIELQPHE